MMGAMQTAARALASLTLVALVACGTPPSASPTTSASTSASSASAEPSDAPSATPSATPSAPASLQPSASPSVPEPGRPYDAAAILDAMRNSRRPGGVPQQLQTDAVAQSLASAIWTYGGEAWQQAPVIGASCGPQRCTVDVAGTPAGGAGEDLYTFSVVPESGATSLLVADLHGYPAQLDAALDALVRSQLEASRLEGLAMAGARWLPPPDSGQFVLSYRSGGEEGSPALDVVVDLPGGKVLEVRRPSQ